MIRLFTALALPDLIAERLQPLQRGLEGARWIEREDLHITLRFLGDVPENIADDFDGELRRIPFTPLKLELEGVGVFGGEWPKALYAGVRQSEPLRILQQRHEAAARHVGLKPEKRNFMPHVTLARLRAVDTDPAYQFVSAHNLFASPPFEVTQFGLYSARDSVGGGPYVCECLYPDAPQLPGDEYD